MKQPPRLFFQSIPAVLAVLLLFGLNACSSSSNKPVTTSSNKPDEKNSVVLHVLGTLQDGGAPHAGCKKQCCSKLFTQPNPRFKVVSLGLVEAARGKSWLFEATPDMASQLAQLQNLNPSGGGVPDGIFLTHAHIGHYSGLMYLGREAMNARQIPVYAMPRMKVFLENNGPWSQLVKLENVKLVSLNENEEVLLEPHLKVIPFCVPHRDEFSETVGYKISGPNKSVLFIPDIDKWQKWHRSIVDEIRKVDYALLDATFFSGEEIGHRNIAEIPHPFVIESMQLFEHLPATEKRKIRFIHFNHTNPLLRNSDELQLLRNKGFNVAQFSDSFPL